VAASVKGGEGGFFLRLRLEAGVVVGEDCRTNEEEEEEDEEEEENEEEEEKGGTG
jgi:hypothetical protein